MNNIYKYLFAVAVLAIGFVSCDGLDELPDNRTQMDSAEKIASLMTSAYPVSSYAVICEYSGDNFLDDNVVVPATHSSAYSQWMDEMYEWRDVKNYSTGSDDTPFQVWQSYYGGISVCNHAIAAMKEMSNDPANDPAISASWGEAHVLRAYCHFILVNLFAEAYKNEELSKADRGIPYVTKVEDVVSVDYNSSEFTHDVAETYRLIEQDLLEGMPHINDNAYKVKAFHFNKAATNAFAARFYLFHHEWEKAEKYANAALGDNPSTIMRKWQQLNMNTAYTKRDSYWDEKADCNFLIQSTYSLQWRYLMSVTRHSVNEPSKDLKTVTDGKGVKHHVPNTLAVSLYGTGPSWGSYLPCYDGLVYINSSGQEYGCYHMHLIEFFEYSDKIAGIGYVHMLYLPFSAEETLLCRAEAKLYQNNVSGCIDDLKIWSDSKASATRKMNTLDLNSIVKFYSSSTNADYVTENAPEHMGFKDDEVFADGTDKKYILDCILHFRRVETLHNGDRWFDIKRYGIKVKHLYRGPKDTDITADSLMWNDKRRVLQLPVAVTEAGYESNRPSYGGGGVNSSSGYQTSSPFTGAIKMLNK